MKKLLLSLSLALSLFACKKDNSSTPSTTTNSSSNSTNSGYTVIFNADPASVKFAINGTYYTFPKGTPYYENGESSYPTNNLGWISLPYVKSGDVISISSIDSTNIISIEVTNQAYGGSVAGGNPGTWTWGKYITVSNVWANGLDTTITKPFNLTVSIP